MSQRFDVVVVGCGVAGLSAAAACRRSGLATATLEAFLPGGLVLNVNHLDGEMQGSGMDLATQLATEAGALGAEHIPDAVTSLQVNDGGFVVATESRELAARVVIVASGARLKRLGIPGEIELDGCGVSQCADCDGPLFQGQDVVVVGGGDSALQEALALANYARNVHLLHRRGQFRARTSFVEAVANEPRITIHASSVAEAVLGNGTVEGIRAKELGTGKTHTIPCTGFFAYVGLEPVCEFVPEAAARDPGGHLLTDAEMRTTLPGLYAAGAVRSGNGGLLVDAAADGSAAASAAKVYVNSVTPA